MNEKLVAEARSLCAELDEIHRRMTEPEDDFEAINDYRLDQVEDMRVQAYRRYERRLRLMLLAEA